jgi:hypothetical protein
MEWALSRCGCRDDVDAAAIPIKHHCPLNQGEQGVILALSYILARMKHGSHLPDKDVPGADGFAAKPFYTPPLRIGIATVTAGALSLFMCHFPNLSKAIEA